MKFKIYYANCSTYEGETEEDAFKAPTVGVQLTKQEVIDSVRGYSLRHGCNFHCWEGFRWGGKSDIFGLMDYYTFHKGPQKVLIGREIHDDLYQKICRQAVKDGCFCKTNCNHLKADK